MALTPSAMVELGTPAPEFSLPNIDGRSIELADFDGCKALVVVFMCNHCPFVIHVREQLAALGREYQALGVGMVGINANDVSKYPADSPAKMAEEANAVGYTFPYLFDESQSVARAYGAECTPDIFVYDSEFKLVYRGQLDESRPGNDVPVTGEDLRAALDAMLDGRPVSPDQRPSAGCNIKWRE